MRIGRNILNRFLVIFSCTFLAGCTGELTPPEVKTEFLLGTTCTIKLYDRTTSAVFEKAFARIREIESEMSVTDERSELSAVNRAAGSAPVPVSEDTFFVCSKAYEYSLKSGGAFDISIGPIVTLWGIGTEHARVPVPDEIRQRLSKVDYRKIVLNEKEGTLFLKEKGMGLDVGGIAKGFAADEVVKVLKADGINRGIIDLGGNIYAFGKKSPKQSWRIGIQEPGKERGSYIGIVEVENTSVVSSGNYERFFIKDGVRYHHILDPKTGYPVQNGLTDVTIISRSSIEADALSTAVFVLGIERGFQLINSLKGVEGIMLTEDHKIYLSSGIKKTFKLTNPQYTLVDDPTR
ncbi:MAG: FAD:protein FMN transferase [Spirochaetota bacterium]